MDHPYSFWADVLSKFQGSTPWIQALWLILTAAVVLGAIWCLTDLLKTLLGGLRRREKGPRVIHGIVEDGEGWWGVYKNGVVAGVAGWTEDFAASDVLQESRRAQLPLQR